MVEISRGTFKGRLGASAATALIGGPASYIVQRVLGAWGVLDPMADAFGKYLKVSVTAGQVGWTLALLIVAAIYAFILVKIWRPVHIHHLPIPGETKPVATSSRQFLPAPQRDVSLAEALAFAEFKEWGRTFFDAASSAQNEADEQSKRFRQLAHDGNLTVWGKRTENGVFQLIPKEHWLDHNIEWFDLLRGNPRTENVMHTTPQPYSELMANKAEFEREWPHA